MTDVQGTAPYGRQTNGREPLSVTDVIHERNQNQSSLSPALISIAKSLDRPGVLMETKALVYSHFLDKIHFDGPDKYFTQHFFDIQ